MAPKVLVGGIGNIFLGDDAFGVEVAVRLARLPMPNNVKVVDFGIRSYDLAFALMDEWDLVILVDALPNGGAPGTLYVLEPELSETSALPAIDAHTMNPVGVLDLVRRMGGGLSRLMVVGCEPESVEPGQSGKFDLTPLVAAAVPEAMCLVEKLIISAQNKAAAA